jgi:hypothetical protein
VKEQRSNLKKERSLKQKKEEIEAGPQKSEGAVKDADGQNSACGDNLNDSMYTFNWSGKWVSKQKDKRSPGKGAGGHKHVPDDKKR